MRSFLKKSKNFIWFWALFLFAEYLRILADNAIERSAENLLFCIIVMIWAVSLRRRIFDAQMRKVLLGLAMSVVILFVVRTCKYVIFDENTILWYMYYIPLTMMPVYVFFMTRRIKRQQASDTNRLDICCGVGLVLLNGMILTNDLHQFVFRFETPDDINTYSYGIGYMITIAWIAIFVILALYTLYRVCRLPQSRSKIWVPVIPLVIGTMAIAMEVFHMVPKINDTKIYLFQEIVIPMVVFIVESCIYIGIIPSNDGYEEIFANSKINACKTDDEGQVVYSADEKHMISEELRKEGKNKRVMIDDYTRLHSTAINGGMLYYTEDIQNYMAKAMVLNAYIKRRINLSLIAMEHAQMQLEELSLAIEESLTYLKYSKKSTSILNNVRKGRADADSYIKVYDAFEELLEAYYEKMSAYMVTIDEKKDSFFALCHIYIMEK